MMVKILTVLFTVALVVSSGLKDPQRSVSSRVGRRSVMDVFEDRRVHSNTSVSQCLPGSQLVFDVNSTLQESKRLNRHYFHCPTPEPGVPCFFYKDLFYPVFGIKGNVSGELDRFLGSYTFKVVGGGPYSRDNIRRYSEEEILKYSSFSDSATSGETLVWTLQNIPDSVNVTKEGFLEMRDSLNWVRWVCQRNSPCGDLTPEGLLDPDFFFIIEVSNKEVDRTTYCEHTAQFELHVHGLPLMPLRALFYMGMTLTTIVSILFLYILYGCCVLRQQKHSTAEQDSLEGEEDEGEEEEGGNSDRAFTSTPHAHHSLSLSLSVGDQCSQQSKAEGALRKDWWTHVEQIYNLLLNFTETPLFNHFILLVVVLDTLMLIALAFPSVSVRAGWVFSVVDACFLGIYLMEFFLKLVVLGHNYFLNHWNNMDLIIVVMSVVDFTLPLLQSTGLFSSKQTSSIFRMLKIMKGARAVRAFRLLKAMRSFHTLQVILATAVKSLRSIGSTSCIMILILSMFAIFLRVLYSQTDPERFGSIFSTTTTLFQVLTLDDWSLVYSTSSNNGAAHIMIFLVLYILVENLILLNIILAVLVDNLGLTINKTNQQIQNAQEDELQCIREIELELSEPQIEEEELHQEALRQHFSSKNYSKRKIELMTMYLRLLTNMEQTQYSIGTDAYLMERLVESSFKDEAEETIQ
ncbi:cation channel sperm-associated protein 1-like [Salminus brasiliensis]|uniref:cation channel sperm-associated protein 1-like n=1 Tax=Salminus brasiliensis TaxID=930266 RepID=UPI003B83829C